MTGHALVPDIIIGGGPSSGTTFLCSLLSKHPDVYVPRPFIPEPTSAMTSHPAGDPGLLERYAVLFADAPGSRRQATTLRTSRRASAVSACCRRPNLSSFFASRSPAATIALFTRCTAR